MSDKATLLRLLRQIGEAKRTEEVIIAEDSIVKLFDSVRDELVLRAEKAEAESAILRAALIEFRTYFLSFREDGFVDGDVEALKKVRDALRGR